MTTFHGGTKSIYVLILFVSGIISCFVSVDGRVLDAQQLCIGDWSINLRCGKEFYSSLLFPPRITPAPPSHHKTRRKSGFPFLPRSFPCDLSIYPNGTFVMQPRGTESTREPNSERLQLRGRWSVLANPYCVTDRFYDQLQLESYPRNLVVHAQQQHDISSTTVASINKNISDLKLKLKTLLPLTPNHGDNIHVKEQSLKRVSLTMNCRVRGRYASPGLRRRISWPRVTTARLTQGAMMWEIWQTGSSQRRWGLAAPSVGASFTGKRAVQLGVPSKYEQDQDADIFGY